MPVLHVAVRLARDDTSWKDVEYQLSYKLTVILYQTPVGPFLCPGRDPMVPTSVTLPLEVTRLPTSRASTLVNVTYPPVGPATRSR